MIGDRDHIRHTRMVNLPADGRGIDLPADGQMGPRRCWYLTGCLAWDSLILRAVDGLGTRAGMGGCHGV